jgi:cell division transport system permease protein
MRSLPFLIREALANLRRHGLMTMAAVSTIAIALLLLGGFLLTFYQMESAARRTVDEFEMRVFCRLDVSGSVWPTCTGGSPACPASPASRYLSREAVWAEQTKHFPIDTAGVPNQMPDTFVVKLADAKAAGPVARVIRGWHGDVDAVSVPEQEMTSVLRLAGFVRAAARPAR